MQAPNLHLKGTDKLQGLDYVYTVNGQLKAINHPSLDEAKDPGQDGKSGAPNAGFAKDVFGLTLDYHQSDYIRTSSNVLSSSDGSNPGFYNGRIHAQRWKMRATTNGVNNGADYLDYGGANQAQLISGTTEEHMNRYAYDDEYRLSTAVFGTFNNSVPTFTASTANNYKEFGPTTGIEYDVNGNITRLKRNGYSGTIGLLMDDLTYTYTSNTNKLASIIDGATSTYPNDFDAATSKTFSYNTLGQMTATQAESVTDITYRPNGKTKVVTFTGGNTATYDYNERGIKCKTKYYNGTNNKFTWYVTDAGGNILAVYDYDQAETPTPTFRLQEQPVYGSGRIGTYDRVSSLMEYECKDHLGNIRTVFKAIGTGTVQITARTDYYSFGGPLPGRSYNLGTYRFNYQGQETAVNQNWENFELRMYNYDLGRFCSPDPMGQFYSPYTGMGNMPNMSIDPTGGYVFTGGGRYDIGWQLRWVPYFDGESMNHGNNAFNEYDGFDGPGWGIGGGGSLNQRLWAEHDAHAFNITITNPDGSQSTLASGISDWSRANDMQKGIQAFINTTGAQYDKESGTFGIWMGSYKIIDGKKVNTMNPDGTRNKWFQRFDGSILSQYDASGKFSKNWEWRTSPNGYNIDGKILGGITMMSMTTAPGATRVANTTIGVIDQPVPPGSMNADVSIPAGGSGPINYQGAYIALYAPNLQLHGRSVPNPNPDRLYFGVTYQYPEQIMYIYSFHAVERDLQGNIIRQFWWNFPGIGRVR